MSRASESETNTRGYRLDGVASWYVSSGALITSMLRRDTLPLVGAGGGGGLCDPMDKDPVIDPMDAVMELVIDRTDMGVATLEVMGRL